MFRKVYLLSCLLLLLNTAIGQTNSMQALLDSLQTAGQFPGLSLAVIKENKPALVFVAGYNDKEKKIPLSVDDMMLQGSVGKTYESALAIKLIMQGKLGLDQKVSAYLGHYDWFGRLPNAADVTVRMLMNHSSGIMRYEFKPAFQQDLSADPDKVWKPEELISYVLDEKAAFDAGEGWDYSDTNYILLGKILEKLTGKPYYELLQAELLNPHQLLNTRPSDRRLLPGLAQGYAGDANAFGGRDKVIDADGLFIINPQFEWAGGGLYSTTADLARWGMLLYGGKIIDTTILLSSAVPAKLGPNTKYGLGVIIRSTPLGPSYGHSGFFPGYLTELAYFPQQKMTIALQCNSSDFKTLKLSLQRCMIEIAKQAGK